MISYVDSKQIALSIILSGFIWLLLIDNFSFSNNGATRTIINFIIVIPAIFLSFQSFLILIKDGNMKRLKSFEIYTKEFLIISLSFLVLISIGLIILDNL